jgi:hypothetical protein
MSPSEFYPGVSYGLMYCREIEQAGGQYTAIFSVQLRARKTVVSSLLIPHFDYGLSLE